MLLATIVTSVVLGVTIVFAVAGWLIELSARHFEQGEGKRKNE
ncbi:MAG TPA: hypothetical protein VHY84_05530 [Bryobacteraceae bacterium]|jgi:putative effector of murein hydrolase LrgA (UPF0299 family)|nr:hypothetical protein [Bryobacteraceae bacterium]